MRNRVKRLLREAFRECAQRLPGDYDYVLIARPQLTELLDAPDKGAVPRPCATSSSAPACSRKVFSEA